MESYSELCRSRTCIRARSQKVFGQVCHVEEIPSSKFSIRLFYSLWIADAASCVLIPLLSSLLPFCIFD